jgi:hypothetical protein
VGGVLLREGLGGSGIFAEAGLAGSCCPHLASGRLPVRLVEAPHGIGLEPGPASGELVRMVLLVAGVGLM